MEVIPATTGRGTFTLPAGVHAMVPVHLPGGPKASRAPGETRGPRRSPEYRAWSGMVSKCHRRHDKKYPQYGGRGITVCARWRYSYDAFLGDVGRRPAPGYAIVRREIDEAFSKDNSFWGTRRDVQQSRTDSTFLTFNGRTANVHYWARSFDLAVDTIRYRLAHGWSVERALTTRPRSVRRSRSQ